MNFGPTVGRENTIVSDEDMAQHRQPNNTAVISGVRAQSAGSSITFAYCRNYLVQIVTRFGEHDHEIFLSLIHI